jgi:hypothetical protein
MALILIGIEGLFGMNWLVCLAGGTCLVVLRVILMLPVSLVKGRLRPFFLAMMEFSDFIFYQGLMDLPLFGGTFTWSNNWDPTACSRIDRFLLSSVRSLFLGVS